MAEIGSLPTPGQKPWNLNPAITAINAELEGRLSDENLNATIEELAPLKVDFIRRAGEAVLTNGDVVLLGRFAHAAAATATNVIMGGAGNTENVVGGNLDNVLEAGESAAGKPSNLAGAAPLTGQNNGNWNALLGGYDIVVRGWANIVAGHHLKVTDDANHCHIGGGSYHSVAAAVAYATISGGTMNILGTGATGGTIAGGLRNSLTGASATIGGGQDNTVAGARATVAGGRNHVASAESSAIGGGQDNTASGTNTSIMGGRNNTASGIGAAVTGGGYNTASGTYSRAGGRGAVASHGQDAFASQEFATPGDAQTIRQIIKRQTTDATASDLYDTAGLTPTCPENTSWAIRTRVIARRTETSVDTAAWDVTIVVHRGVGNTGAIIGTATVTALGASAGAATWTCTVSTHSDGRVRIIGTGEAGKTIRWVGSQEIVQVKQ